MNSNHICFVCGNAIHLTGIYQDNALYIGKDKAGKDLYRHKYRCAPLTENYNRFVQQPKPVLVALLIILFTSLMAQPALANPVHIKCSWYSIASLQEEGTWKTSKGVMANGKLFQDSSLTCATRLYPLGTVLHIKNKSNGKAVTVKVTDRIGKRFANKRIDLSKRAFSQIAALEQGLVSCVVKKVRSKNG
jgi:rare lipoprotein A